MRGSSFGVVVVSIDDDLSSDSGIHPGFLCVADSLVENKSVMAGGSVPGWTPDVAVVLWQRMLGCLGDINKIEDPDIHETVFVYLCDLLDTLFRVSFSFHCFLFTLSVSHMHLLLVYSHFEFCVSTKEKKGGSRARITAAFY